ncbi:Interferon-induced protein 44-like [Mactra antiquata]
MDWLKGWFPAVFGDPPSNDPPPPPKVQTDTPWRSLESETTSTIVQAIEKLDRKKTPGILVTGPTAAGKSSFINSCLSVGAGRRTAIAQSGNAVGSYTLEFKQYHGSKLLSKFRFMDSMGIEGTFGKGINPLDITYLLQGHIKSNYKFDQDKAIDKESKFYRHNPKLEDKIHCVVFVIDAKTMKASISQAHVDKIKWIQNEIKKADVPRVIILTKCDLLCDKVKENADNIFKSMKVKRAVDTASELFSIEKSSVYPVINYEVDVVLSTAKNVPILLALGQILGNACDFVERAHDVSDKACLCCWN